MSPPVGSPTSPGSGSSMDLAAFLEDFDPGDVDLPDLDALSADLEDNLSGPRVASRDPRLAARKPRGTRGATTQKDRNREAQRRFRERRKIQVEEDARRLEQVQASLNLIADLEGRNRGLLQRLETMEAGVRSASETIARQDDEIGVLRRQNRIHEQVGRRMQQQRLVHEWELATLQAENVLLREVDQKPATQPR